MPVATAPLAATASSWPEPVLGCRLSDTASCEAVAGSDTPVRTNAGLAPVDTTHLLFANLETLGVGGPQPRMPTSLESRFAMNSGATPAPTPRSRRCLRIA